jgi:hypothetical protein
MQGAADRTNPFTVRQGECLVLFPTLRAGFAGGRVAVDDAEAFAVPGCLVVQLAAELPERGVRDGAGHALRLHHPRHGQVFDTDHVVVRASSVVILWIRSRRPSAIFACVRATFAWALQ